MNRCPTCGSNYGDDARFCTHDGARLVTVSPTNPAHSLGAALAASTSRARAAGPQHPIGSASVPHANLLGQTLDSRYQIDKKIGEGGMSFVYLATDLTSGDRCAIKVLSAALSQDANAMARLRREATMGMRLAH